MKSFAERAHRPATSQTLALVLILLLGSCSDNAINYPDTSDDRPDTTADDLVEETSPDDAVDGDAEDGSDTDADGPLVPGPAVGGECEFQWDCDPQFLCADGLCHRLERCGDRANWVECVEGVEELEPGLGYRAVCLDGWCSILCETDQDCKDGETCTDFGFCKAYDGEITALDPGGEEHDDLQAGYGEVLLNFPIGAPLAGFGSRAAFGEGRYAESLQRSAGQLHGLFVRAVFIDNGERQLIVLRAPIIFPSMALHEVVSQALQERTGKDWRDSLIISATHSHSGPARFWHVPADAAMSVGAFGIGEYSQEIYDWMAQSFIDAAFAAIDDSEPAKLGWDIVESFDPHDFTGRDRWGETPPFDDNRVLLIRIDDLEGIPKAVLFSFGAHAAENSGNYFSNDVHHGAERSLENALGDEFGRYVPTMFVNQNSGTMTTGSGARGHSFPQSLERYGYTFVDQVFESLLAMETSADISLRSRTLRFPITYDLLGYSGDEFSTFAPIPFGGTYRYGGIECYSRLVGSDEDYTTHGASDDMTCIPLHFMLHNHSPTIFMKSQVTTLELAGLTVVTMPGELSMELSWEILRELRDEHEVDPLAAWTWGYAQDHLLYLMPTNLRGEMPPYPGISLPKAPDEYEDFAISYLQGGYEPGMSPWGYRLGDYLVARSLEAYENLIDPEFAPSMPVQFPSIFTPYDQPPFPIDDTDLDEIGTIITDLPEQISRFETVEFAWLGGDPGAEMPQSPLVILEHETEDGSFEELTLPNFQRYDNRAFRFMTRLRETDAGWEWIARWEELKDFPAGNYRLKIEGHHQADGERLPYSLTSRVFEFIPIENVVVTAEADAAAICGTLGYPPPEWLLYTDDWDDPGEVTGNFRMRHPMVPTRVSDPLETDVDVDSDGLALTVSQGESAVEVGNVTVELATDGENVSGRGNVPVTRYCLRFEEALATGEYTSEIIVTDLHGNSGAVEVTFTVP